MTKPLTSYDDCRRTLVAMLRKTGDGPINGINDLSVKDRTFLLVTCASRIIEQTICDQVHFKEKEALEAFALLVEDMHGHISAICQDAQ